MLRFKSTLFSIVFSGLTAFFSQISPANEGFYKNFAELARVETVGIDYRIFYVDRQSPVTLLAIHGGKIESGTSELAQAIAQGDFNLYLFEGLKAKGNQRLHITSTFFDEPRAIDLVHRSRYCISIHGFKYSGKQIYIGGANSSLRTSVMTQLKSRNFPIEIVEFRKGMEGLSKRNIVNQSQERGVQIELSTGLREELWAHPDFRLKLAQAIRNGVLNYRFTQ